MTNVKLSEQAQQTVDRTKAQFLLVQPDGSIKRRGEWAFNSESYVRNVAAKQPDLRVYDRRSGEYLEAITTDTAVMPEVVSEPVIVAPVDPTPSGAALDASAEAAADLDHQPVEGEAATPPATPILDAMINVLADGKPRGKRPGRSKKDGKPRALSAKAEKEPKAPKAKKGKVDRGVATAPAD